MKILQIVTLITPDGAYGGPVRVAVNQARALSDAGHDVTLAAAAAGFEGALPTEFDGVPVRLFPVRRMLPGIGFAGLTSPALLRWLWKALPAADIVHVHLARDFVTLPAAQMARKKRLPYVVQTHGMIDRSSHPLALPLDAIFTRPILRRASKLLYLTSKELADVTCVAGGSVATAHLPNGVPIHKAVCNEDEKTVEVLFLARLHERKRPLYFVEMAKRLHAQHPTVRFRLVGPDEGEGTRVRAAIRAAKMGSALEWEGAIGPHETIERMRQAALYVLPSINEPFPMSVLEAMSLGIPAVVTQSCGLHEAIASAGAGAVTDETIDSLVEAVTALLERPDELRAAGERAGSLIRSSFGMNAISSTLEALYRDSAGPKGLEPGGTG